VVEPVTGERSARAGALILDLARRRDARCAGCGAPVCGHELLFGVVLGFRDAPRCTVCLARALGREAGALRGQLVAHIRRRDCYEAAWAWTSAREGACQAARADGEAGAAPENPAGDEITPDAEWDAGDMGCGDLVLELRTRLRAMRPGEVLTVTAHDPGAPEDLPAWCRMTGHRLVYARHPVYCIRRKED